MTDKKTTPIIYGSIKRGIVSSDLLEERAKKDFHCDFTKIIYE